MVQLVGNCYGAEPSTPDPQFGRVSYTQFEALYAEQRGKKVWYLLLGADFPADAASNESDELRQLQVTYRERIQKDVRLYHSLATNEALENSVLKLRNELGRLRRGIIQWAVSVTALLAIVGIAIIWILHGQQREGAKVNLIVDRYQKMQQALAKLAEVESREDQFAKKASPAEQRARAYRVLETDLGLPSGSLAQQLPAFALEIYSRADTSPLLRAQAAYALNKFDEAEKLSADAADQDRIAYNNAKAVADDRRKKAIEDYQLAGESAERLVHYDAALQYFRKAEELTDRTRDPIEWALQQFNIGHLMIEQGQFAQSETLYREAVEQYRRVRGEDNQDILNAHCNLAIALYRGGKYPEAETESKAVIQVEEKILGSEHRDTLRSRATLANAFSARGKRDAAERELRAILPLSEKVLGADDRETLQRRNDLAAVLGEEGKYREAETEFRSVATVNARVLGPEHPQTLIALKNAALALELQGNYPEAEKEFRAVEATSEKVLGPEHPHTLEDRSCIAMCLIQERKYAEAELEQKEVIRLRTKVLGPEHPLLFEDRSNLGVLLDDEGKYAEAEAEDRSVIKVEEKIIGAENPTTLDSRDNLIKTLEHEGKHVEAEIEARTLIKAEEKVIGPKHPTTLSSYHALAQCLTSQDKTKEAREFAQRAVDGANETLGPNHPSTIKYLKLLQELKAK